MHNGGKVSPYLLLVRRRRGKKEREKSKRKWEKEFFFSFKSNVNQKGAKRVCRAPHSGLTLRRAQAVL